MDAKCSCGRLKSEAQTRVYHSRDTRYTFHRCECGQEWTDKELTVDPRDPVSSEEVIEIHERLEKFEGPLSDLF